MCIHVYLQDFAFINFQSKRITIILSFTGKLYGLLFVFRRFIRRIIRRGEQIVKIHCVFTVSRKSGSSILRHSSISRRSVFRRFNREGIMLRGRTVGSTMRQSRSMKTTSVFIFRDYRSFYTPPCYPRRNNSRGRIAGKIERDPIVKVAHLVLRSTLFKASCDTANRVDLKRIIE